MLSSAFLLTAFPTVLLPALQEQQAAPDAASPRADVLVIVVDREGEPASGLSVVLNWTTAGGRARQERGRTSARGRCRLTLDPDGAFGRLQVDGHPRESVQHWVIEGPRTISADRPLRLELQPPAFGSLSGLVLDRAGSPVEDALVALESARHATAPGIWFVQGRRATASADNGSFHFDRVVGEVELSAAIEARYAVDQVHGRVAPGEEVEGVRVPLREMRAPLDLRVFAADGSQLPPRGAFTLRLDYLGDALPPPDPSAPGFGWRRQQPYYMARPVQGRSRLENLALGRWRVRIVPHDPAHGLPREVEVEEDDREVAIRLRSAAGEPDHRPPNIVFFLVDDMGWNGAGFAGSSWYETPHMDRLAAEGMVFTQAYSNGPNCAPSRACLMSGQDTPRHGIHTVNTAARGKRRFRKLVPIENTTVLADEVVTVAEALKEAGYATGSVGKWHLGPDPRTQGFDLNVAGAKRGHPRTYFSPYGIAFLEDGPEGEYLTDRLAEEALTFIREHRDEPFFLYLSHYAVHTPIEGKPELVERYRAKPPSGGQENAKYAAMTETTDASLGRVLEELASLGLSEDTIVILTSDNGGHGPVTSLAPLRGSKGMLYEGGIRVPLVVRWPGRVAPGSRCAVPVIGTDFYPTFLDVAGAEAPAGQPLDGASLLPLLEQSGDFAERAIHWHFPAYLQASQPRIQGRWRTTPVGVIRSGRWKLMEWFEDGRLELYDLDADPGETTDLAAEHAGTASALHERMKRWREEVGAQVPVERNPFYRP